jgi:hypothetical protein
MNTRRTLRLRKDVLTELTDSELAAVDGGHAITQPQCPTIVIRTMPLYSCLFVCTEA